MTQLSSLEETRDLHERFPLQNKAMEFLKETYNHQLEEPVSRTVKESSSIMVQEKVAMKKASKIQER